MRNLNFCQILISRKSPNDYAREFVFKYEFYNFGTSIGNGLEYKSRAEILSDVIAFWILAIFGSSLDSKPPTVTILLVRVCKT